MSRINVGRLVLGGLVAGVVANGLDYLTAGLVSNEMSEMASRLNLSQARLDASMPIWIGVDFIWGLLLVFAYAAMRPRFEPGPKTAAIAGVTLWFGVLIMFAGLMAMGIFTQVSFVKSGALSLVSSLAAVLAGAAVYRE